MILVFGVALRFGAIAAIFSPTIPISVFEVPLGVTTFPPRTIVSKFIGNSLLLRWWKKLWMRFENKPSGADFLHYLNHVTLARASVRQVNHHSALPDGKIRREHA